MNFNKLNKKGSQKGLNYCNWQSRGSLLPGCSRSGRYYLGQDLSYSGLTLRLRYGQQRHYRAPLRALVSSAICIYR